MLRQILNAIAGLSSSQGLVLLCLLMILTICLLKWFFIIWCICETASREHLSYSWWQYLQVFFYLEIGNKLFDIIKSSRLTADSRMSMFTIFHNNSLQDHDRKLWIDLLENEEFPTSVCNILYQYILDKFLKYALKHRNKQFEKEELTVNCESTKLEESEE